MNRKTIVDKLMNRKTKDYTFTIVFFIIFSFFVLFVIRPNITTVFVLQQQLNDLQKLDKDYEKAIFTVVNIQSALEKNREQFPLLNQAVPSTPQVNQIIDDVKKIASDSGIELKKFDINQINLKESKNKNSLKPYNVDIETSSDFVKANKFMSAILQQRRLKSIKNLIISKDQNAGTESAALKIIFEIEGYYL